MEKTNYYLQGIVKHDRKVLQEIYTNYAHRIEQLVKSTGGNTEDAKDVFQDAIMVIYRKAKQPDFVLTSQFYTYLHSIARFIWDRKRKKKSNNTVTIPEDNRYTSEQDLENSIIKQERMSLYQKKFAQLGGDCQRILELFFANESMTYIAEDLDLANENAVSSRKYRCIQKLKKLVEADIRYKELVE